MNSSEHNELRTKLNPTVFTSRAPLMGGTANGDKYADRLLDMLGGFEENTEQSGDSRTEELYRFTSTYGTAVWVRNRIANKMFNSLKMMSFLDLGCGFNPRGLYLADGRLVRYYGIDLPPVIDRMKTAMQPITSIGRMKERIMYFSVDVTDHNALRSVLKDRAPLFIVTEGLMMYLTEKEMQTVVENISMLLQEFGGVWFTGDSEERTFFDNILRQFIGNDERAIKKLMGTELSEKWRNLLYNNSFMKLKDDDFKKFLKDKGLNCRKAEIRPFMRDINMPNNISKAFEETSFLVMTSTESDMKYNSPERRAEFSLVTEKNENGITIAIHGRLDSLTAPKLVEEYDKNLEDGKVIPVVINMSDCPYVSSAGIRAILMLFKRTAVIKDGFALSNIRPEVLEILDVTGFKELIDDV